MTNFEYIMKNMKDTDLAAFMAQDFDTNVGDSILTKADKVFWSYSTNFGLDRATNVLFQMWLSKQYNEKEWEEALEN